MRRFKLTLFFSSVLFFALFLGFWELSVYTIEKKLLVGGSFFALYLIFLFAFVYRFTSPLERIFSAIVPYDEDFSSKLAIDSLGRKGPFREIAISLNALIEKAGSHIQHSREKDREMEGILDSLNEGVIAFNVRSKVIFINDKARAMLRVSRVEMIGKSLDVFEQSLLAKCHDLVVRALQTSEMVSQKWTEEEVFFELVASPLTHQTGAILVIQDKTSDWKMVEVGKNFIANASHELRTPITIIRGFAEVLQSELTPEMKVEVTEKIVRTCDRLDNLVKSLLTITDLENLSENRFVPCSLVSLIENCMHVLTTAYSDVDLQIKAEEEDLVVLGDFGLLDLAIMNLLENAVKYSTAPKKIQIQVNVENGQVSVLIQDHGIGIPLKDLPHIFDRFYRVDKARQRSSGGAGLGLSMVKMVIEKHRGEVTVTSEEGKGSCFKVQLPLLISV